MYGNLFFFWEHEGWTLNIRERNLIGPAVWAVEELKLII